jgi:hypothetical protein
MTRMPLLVTFGVGAAAVAASACNAAPPSHGANAIFEANATMNLVEEVHGTHRVCVRGWVPRWGLARWHRHVGLAHVPVRC